MALNARGGPEIIYYRRDDGDDIVMAAARHREAALLMAMAPIKYFSGFIVVYNKTMPAAYMSRRPGKRRGRRRTVSDK